MNWSVIAACAALCVFAISAEAAPLPGTPDHISVLFYGPKLELSFLNTADGPVGFALEATVDGVSLGRNVLDHVSCVSDKPYACNLQAWVMLAEDFAAVPGSMQGILLGDVKPGARYCFRISAFSADQRDARNWSKQVCARAPLGAMDALAARGAALVEDALANELRGRQQGGDLRGFNIGLAIAVNDTAPGPGKTQIRDSLPPEQRDAYEIAVSYSLQRNINANNAALGARIIEKDPAAAQARSATSNDVFYWLGFDIATAIFGNPALGAAGNTLAGPGSTRIHDTLGQEGRKGFEAGQAYHLGRKYR